MMTGPHSNTHTQLGRYRTRSYRRSCLSDDNSGADYDMHAVENSISTSCMVPADAGMGPTVTDTFMTGTSEGVPPQTLCQTSSSRAPLTFGRGPSVACSRPTTMTLAWRGELWYVQTSDIPPLCTPSPLTPVPVRIPSMVVSAGLGVTHNSTFSGNVLGLVIQSYTTQSTQQLYHTVILDDGQELQVCSADAHPVLLIRHCEGTEGLPNSSEARPLQEFVDNVSLNKNSRSGEFGECHINRNAIPDMPKVDLTVHDDADDAWLSWAEFGEEDDAIMTSVACTAEAPVAVDVPVEVMREGSVALTPQVLQGATMLFLSERSSQVHRELLLPVHGAPVEQTPVRRVRVFTEGTWPPILAAEAAVTVPLQTVPLPGRVESTSQSADAQGLPSSAGEGGTSQSQSTHLIGERSGELPASCRRKGTAPTKPPPPRPSGETATAPLGSTERRPNRRGRRPSGRLSAAAARLVFLERFADSTWTMHSGEFAEAPHHFSGPPPGPTFPIHRMPVKSALFARFWTDVTWDRICVDTNRYAAEFYPGTRRAMGGRFWWPLQKQELKAFVAVNLLMGIKCLPNHRSYWCRRNQFLQCPSITTIMSCQRYEDITRCLHVADDSVAVVAGSTHEFDKLRKMRWLISELQERFRRCWNLNAEVTVDETMVPYKGKYCPVRQYMPRKPTRWGVKVWCLVDARQRYVWDFQIYSGSQQRDAVGRRVTWDAKTAHDVVLQLLHSVRGRGHIVCTDNFFTSVKLLMELRSAGTYGVGTVRSNRLGLPSLFQSLKALSSKPQGSLLWRMHVSGEIAAVVFVDRKAVGMLSTYFPPVPSPGAAWPTVPRRIEGLLTDVETSPIHKAYTDFMRGVDVVDHLRGNYSCQTRSHKWWHKIFFFLIDTAMVNSYIVYKVAADELGKRPETHLEFQFGLADELSRAWRMQRGAVSRFRMSVPGVHALVRGDRRRKCRVCWSRRRTNLICPQCGGVSLHSGDCFQRSHRSLRR